MGERRRVRPKSRKAWRGWLEKNHASSTGVWLVYAKKHSGLPSLTYNDAVEEALCFGWIDSKINPIDDAFYMQVFTPRKRQSAWSPLNKARVERLLAGGLMTPAGLMAERRALPPGRSQAVRDSSEVPSGHHREYARNLSWAERREMAGFRPTSRSSRSAKR